MKFKDFVQALNDANWFEKGDAQHTQLKCLHAKLWPVVAQLEEENDDLKDQIKTEQDYQNEKQWQQILSSTDDL